MLDSIENCSDGDMAEDIETIAVKPQDAVVSKNAKSAKSKKKALDTKRRDSDSEEEDTVQLHNPDLAGGEPPSESGGVENGSQGTGSKKKRTSDVKTGDVKAAGKSRRGKKKGRGGAALASEPVRSKRKGQNKQV